LKFLTQNFEKISVPDGWRPCLLHNVRADLCAKSIWYYGKTSRLLSLRAVLSDGSLCTLLYRLMCTLRKLPLGLLAGVVYKCNAFLTGAVIGRGAQFDPGLVILHSIGVVINSSVRGASNVIIESGVTIGAEKGESPVIGHNVFIGSGAKLIGGIRVGNDVRIGANAVVTRDIPDGATAVGVPAKVVRIRDQEE